MRLKVYGPGIAVDLDTNVAHISAPDVLKHLGCPDTPENREMVLECARRVCAEQLAGVPIEEVD